jgi:hypothetical protein
MANPNPAHNPTDGLLSAVAVQLSGTGVTAQKTPSTGHPYAGSYSVSLSLAGTSSVVVTPSLVDVNNAAYSRDSCKLGVPFVQQPPDHRINRACRIREHKRQPNTVSYPDTHR